MSLFQYQSRTSDAPHAGAAHLRWQGFFAPVVQTPIKRTSLHQNFWSAVLQGHQNMRWLPVMPDVNRIRTDWRTRIGDYISLGFVRTSRLVSYFYRLLLGVGHS